MANEEIICIVRLKAKAGMEQKMRDTLILERARKEPGVVSITAFEDLSDGGHLVLYEVFASEKAMNLYHEKSYHREYEKFSNEILAAPERLAVNPGTPMEYALLKKTSL